VVESITAVQVPVASVASKQLGASLNVFRYANGQLSCFRLTAGRGESFAGRLVAYKTDRINCLAGGAGSDQNI